MNATPNRAPDEHLAGCIALAVGDTLRIVDPHAMLVYVAQGQVWITEEGGGEDIVLRAGEWCRLQQRGVAVAEAFAPTVLMLTSPSAQPARAILSHDRPAMAPRRRASVPAPWEQAWASLRRWWRQVGFASRNVLAADTRRPG